MSLKVSGEDSTDHPALARFATTNSGGERLLLIQAGPHTGRRWFARSWIGKRTGEIHDLSTGHHDVGAELQSLASRLHEDAQLHLAIILPAGASLCSLIPGMPFIVAEHQDLLLDHHELELTAIGGDSSPGRSAQEIHGMCGGWLGPARLLAQAPHTHTPALKVLRGSLLQWMGNRDPEGLLSEAAFLPVFDAPTVEAYYEEFSPRVPTLDDLIQIGVVQADGRDAWMMPSMVRQVLTEAAQHRDPGRVPLLERAAVSAVAQTRGTLAAAQSAIKQRQWAPLVALLTMDGTDLFMASPQKLGAVLAMLPRFITDQTKYLTIAARILPYAGKNGMELPLPAAAPNYAEDKIAQRLHEDTGRLYQKPDARAISIGVLELAHLRLGGMFIEAGEAALQLRQALRRALEDHNLRPSLVSFAELHAGISLQLSGNPVDAQMAYEHAFHAARNSGKPFLLADTSGKLALLAVLNEDSAAAKRWLHEHESAINDVGWGRESLTRTAILARTALAVNRLDFDTVATELAALPALPDNDEFWSMHAYLIAMYRIYTRIPEAATMLINSLRTERRYAANSPLAASVLSDALLLSRAFASTRTPLEAAATSGDPTLQAFTLLVQGQPDAALGILKADAILPPKIQRRKTLAIYLEIAARNPEGPTPPLVDRVQRLHQESRKLAEIMLLSLVPGWQELGTLLDLAPEERQRLEALAAPPVLPAREYPVLTKREKEILAQLRLGMTRRQIAEKGFRSENTIKTQISSLLRKLEASTTSEALEQARSWGL